MHALKGEKGKNRIQGSNRWFSETSYVSQAKRNPYRITRNILSAHSGYLAPQGDD